MTITNSLRRHGLLPALLAILSCFLAACAVGPDYRRPELAAPGAFKSATPAEQAQPVLAADWWTLFNDPALTQLALETLAANQDIRAAIARLDQAGASLRSARGSFFPSLEINASARRSGNAAGTTGNYSLPLDLGYELDVWGRVRRQYEVADNTRLASAADLAFVRQTAVAGVAQAYFTIRLYDAQISVYQQALELYRKQLDLTEGKFKAGLALPTDLLQAKTQVNTAINQLIEVRRARTKQEHVIAIVLGRAPSDYALVTAATDPAIPVIPAGLPVNLLSRRPDVAEAELRLAAANAQIGIAQADFFPSFTLNGAAGYQSSATANLLNWEKRVWSFGPTLNLPIFQGGRLSAALDQTKARYEELVANYRTVVLGAFRDVEDQLSDLHFLAEKAESLEATLVSAREYSRLTQLQYKQGLTNYLQVIDANQTLLNNELSAAQAQSQRLAASVLLIKALGGGWQGPASELSRH